MRCTARGGRIGLREGGVKTWEFLWTSKAHTFSSPTEPQMQQQGFPSVNVWMDTMRYFFCACDTCNVAKKSGPYTNHGGDLLNTTHGIFSVAEASR